MEEREINHIKRNLNQLINNTICGPTCVAHLTKYGIFGMDDTATLDCIPNQRERTLKFYNIAMTKSNSYKHLITALEHSCQSGAVKVLQLLKKESGSEDKVHERKTYTSSAAVQNAKSCKLRKEDHTITTVRFDVWDPVPLFTGGVKELKAIHQKLQQSNTNVAEVSQMLTIAGLGGIGKTELARAYIHHYKEEYENNIIWVNAETEQTFTECFRRLATDYLKLSTFNVDRKEKEITSVIDEIYNFFSGRRSLFVFDNAQSNEHFHKFMPLRVVYKPYLLITSREKDWSFAMAMLDLHEMDQQDANQLVKKGLQIQDDHENAAVIQLVERLQSFPLAISQAISYIKQKRKLFNYSVVEYLGIFYNCLEKLLKTNRAAGELNLYTKTTITCWKVTTDLISANGEVGCRAMLLLNMISYLQPDKIPIKLLLSTNLRGYGWLG